MKKSSDDSNQSGDQSTGHVAGGTLSDPHMTNMQDGEHIGRSSNFGVEHYGYLKDSEGTEQTK